MIIGDKLGIGRKLVYDKYYVGEDGKFVHATPEFYNPHFDGKRNKPKTSKKKRSKENPET